MRILDISKLKHRVVQYEDPDMQEFLEYLKGFYEIVLMEIASKREPLGMLRINDLEIAAHIVAETVVKLHDGRAEFIPMIEEMLHVYIGPIKAAAQEVLDFGEPPANEAIN